MYGKDVIYWEISVVNEPLQEFPNLRVNYAHHKCTHTFTDLCPDQSQDSLNVLVTRDLQDSTGSPSSFIEKLYRRYLVTYFYEGPNLRHTFDLPNDNQSEVEVTVDDQISEDDEYKLEILPNVLDRLCKERLAIGFDALVLFSQAYKKGEKALSLLENILNFKTEYLTSKISGKPSKVTLLGKSIMKQAMQKIQEKSKLMRKLTTGAKILTRVHRYRSRHKIMKFWYHWKLIHFKAPRINTIEFSDESIAPLGDTKRRIIKPLNLCNASRDLEQDSYISCKENHSVNYRNTKQKGHKIKKKLDDLSKYFSKQEKRPLQQNFDTFIKNHDISDRDLVLANNTVKSTSRGKHDNINGLEIPSEGIKNFDNFIDSSNIEVEEIE